jgi:hypothetical protein
MFARTDSSATARSEKPYVRLTGFSDKKRPVKQAVTFLTAFREADNSRGRQKDCSFPGLDHYFLCKLGRRNTMPPSVLPQYNALEKPGFCLTDKAAH